ncbi:MAG: PIN domain-containing protein [Pirellulaceae bacterium]
MHVFIDANILVGFFELASDSLAELEKLIAVIDSGSATLWLPEQAKREFWKNRENNIKRHVRDFEQHRALGDAPLLVREHPQFTDLVRDAKHVDELRREIAGFVKAEVDRQETHADKIIRKLFRGAKPINTDEDEVFNAAWRRAQCHLPPGTKADLGDRLNWVGLLMSLPEGAELHIVADDADYRNEGFSDDIRPYLGWEWQQKKKGKVKLWARISQFLAAHFPDAKNAMDMERGLLAQRLRNSRSFAETHAVIAEVKDLDGFNDEHLRYLGEALVENSQVRAIRHDGDVHEFYSGILNKYHSRFDEDLKAKLTELIGS